MVDKPLVSVITPAYNCGKYITHLFDSLLIQSYPNIEFFVCDDGSTDNIAIICEEYKKKFEKKGYLFKYIYQENSGQSVAINRMIKLIQGKYLVWPDADDFYYSETAIEQMVGALEQTDDDISLVFAPFYRVSDVDYSFISDQFTSPQKNFTFYDCLFELNNFSFCPGKFMAKTCCLQTGIKGMDIYTEKKAGQNWQLLLPLLYAWRAVTISEPLYCVLERENSHSRIKNGYQSSLERLEVYRKTVVNTLSKMNIENKDERDKYILKTNAVFQLKKMRTAIRFLKIRQCFAFYNEYLQYLNNLGVSKISITTRFPFFTLVIRGDTHVSKRFIYG